MAINQRDVRVFQRPQLKVLLYNLLKLQGLIAHA